MVRNGREPPLSVLQYALVILGISKAHPVASVGALPVPCATRPDFITDTDEPRRNSFVSVFQEVPCLTSWGLGMCPRSAPNRPLSYESHDKRRVRQPTPRSTTDAFESSWVPQSHKVWVQTSETASFLSLHPRMICVQTPGNGFVNRKPNGSVCPRPLWAKAQ